MVGISSIPTIAQAIQSMSRPQVPNIQVGTANGEASSAAVAAAVSVPPSGSTSGGSIDTSA